MDGEYNPRNTAAVCEAFSQWAKSTVHAESFGAHIPHIAELKRTARGPLPQIYSWLVKHVTTERTADYMRDLVAYDEQEKYIAQVTNEYEDLCNKRSSLEDECSALEVSVKELNDELAHLESDLLASEEDISVSEQHYHESMKQGVIMRGMSAQLEKRTLVFQEYLTRIIATEMVIENMEKQDAEQSFKATSSILHPNPSGSSLDLSNEPIIQNMCENIKSYVGKKFDGANPFVDGPNEIQLDLENLHRLGFGADLISIPSRSLVQNLASSTAQAARKITNITANIDLTKDAENLRLQIHEGRYQDQAQRPSVLKSIQSLLREARDEHTSHFIEREKILNEEAAYREILNQSLQVYKQKLFCCPEEIRQPISALVEAEVLLEGEMRVQGVLDHLQEIYKVQSQSLEAKYLLMREKHDTIQEFDKENKRNQMIIKSLINQNMHFRLAFQGLANQSSDLVKEVISPCQQVVSAVVPKLRGCAKAELNMFINTPMERLSRIRINGELLQCSELCSAVLDRKHPHIRILFDGLQIPPHTAHHSIPSQLERVMQTALHLENKKEAIHLKLSSVTQLVQSHGLLDDGNYRALQQRHQALEEHIARVHFPALQERAQTSKAAQNDLQIINRLLQEWIDQPAQHIAHWSTVGGLSFKHWLEKWHKLCEKLYGTLS
eukprot:TRINITY_DN5359_c0_g2_i8.p1 TRINITY_DN5359_c0_g2~~TRINITY_DN5359_c0_g2_i8.p1  ORF type:complete len:667 (-),score=146.82 TRINITY_DN5359_c0_g2_i8:91-2091(-)